MSCANTLKEKGLKLTPQRILIMDVIHATDTHLTAEEIISHVQSRMPGVNKSTIYRTLDLLAEAGCIYKSELGDHYIYHHAEEGHHHHMVCSRCERTVDCNEDLFLPVEKSLRERFGFYADFKHMVMSGLCENCRTSTR